MKLHRETLTPQLLQYDDFDDRAETRYLPYLMYFHRPGYRSDVINTDAMGFRISHGRDDRASAGGALPQGPVRLLVGSSTALGIGATSDAATMSSRLWTRYAPSVPWLNFAGRSYNSAQKLLLFVLYRHLLPEVEEIVIYSGFNNLALSRLPRWQQGDHGAFFFCGEYFEQMEELRAKLRKASRGFGRLGDRRSTVARAADADESKPELSEVLTTAADLTVRHLESWQRLAGPQTKITYVLQAMATWLREEHAPQERLLFDELDRISKIGTFEALYGDIAAMETGRAYAELLRAGCERIGVRFVDLNPVVAKEVTEKNWLFVDRAHYTDEGYDVAAELLAQTLNLS